MTAETLEEPYFVEVDTNGCSQCGAGRTYGVVGPDGIALSETFDDEEDAGNLAEQMNDAYAAGRASLTHERQIVEEEHRVSVVSLQKQILCLTHERQEAQTTIATLRDQLTRTEKLMDTTMTNAFLEGVTAQQEIAALRQHLAARDAQIVTLTHEVQIQADALAPYVAHPQEDRDQAIAHTIDQVLQIVRSLHIDGHSVVAPILDHIEREVAALRPQTGETPR